MAQHMPILLLVRFLQQRIHYLCRFIRLDCTPLRFRHFFCGFLAAATFDFALNAAQINCCKPETLKNTVDLASILRTNHHIRNTVISIPVLQYTIKTVALARAMARLKATR